MKRRMSFELGKIQKEAEVLLRIKLYGGAGDGKSERGHFVWKAVRAVSSQGATWVKHFCEDKEFRETAEKERGNLA
jgi:hypothetical protein